MALLEIQAQKIGENFGAFLVGILQLEKIFRANFVLQTCHPKVSVSFFFGGGGHFPRTF